MYKRRIALIMQKVHTKDIVDVIGNLFKKEENKYQLRRKSKFILPRLNTEVGRRSIRYRGPVIWNSIEEGVKEASYSNFKKQLNQIKGKIADVSFKTASAEVHATNSRYQYF